ncbi:unnamed protein product [Sympodiomycopsis kandeliae]
MSFALKGRSAFITGASRGIGLEIAKSLARKGVNVAVAAKSAEPHPKLPGTIHTAVEEINRIGEETGSGSKGHAIQLDVRDERAVEDAIEQTVGKFGGLDYAVNNASAISLKPTVQSTPKQLDLMLNINARGTWLVSRFALPHLLKSAEASRNPHILTLGPPLSHDTFTTNPKTGCWPEQFATTAAAYTLAKGGMALVNLGLSAELNGKVGVNSLWPYTLIGTSAMKVVSPDADVEEKRWRSPEIVAEAAVRMIQEDGKVFNGQWIVDETYLRRNHSFKDDDIAKFSLGGPDTPMENLALDLWISKSLQDDVAKARKGQ